MWKNRVSRTISLNLRAVHVVGDYAVLSDWNRRVCIAYVTSPTINDVRLRCGIVCDQTLHVQLPISLDFIVDRGYYQMKSCVSRRRSHRPFEPKYVLIELCFTFSLPFHSWFWISSSVHTHMLTAILFVHAKHSLPLADDFHSLVYGFILSQAICTWLDCAPNWCIFTANDQRIHLARRTNLALIVPLYVSLRRCRAIGASGALLNVSINCVT